MWKKKSPHHAPRKAPSPGPQTPEEWKAHWEALGQEWRTEPESSVQRQAELEKYRAIQPDKEKSAYPFSQVKLNRADVEWLLATHENGRGPVIWSDESQRERRGLDLRGADLSSDETQAINLTSLPLSRLIGGSQKPFLYNENQKTHVSIHLEGADLRKVHLEGANLRTARLEGANLYNAHLEGADLSFAHLEGASLRTARLEGTTLYNAYLEGATLRKTHLEGADLRKAYLEGANFGFAHLEGANLKAISLTDTHHIGPQIADVQWGSTNLAIVDWSHVTLLGDEYRARQRYGEQRQRKQKNTRLAEYKDAARANRQLAVALQSQGISEDASRFAYHAQVSQKAVFWFQMIQENIPLRTRISYLGNWLFSLFMFLIAGYGYKFRRSLLTYLVVICGFATAYYLLGINDIGPHNIPGPHYLSLYEAFIVSMTAFHGRGFFAGTFSPADPQALVAALEAFLGLLIEVIFIATLTRRLFTQ